MFDKTFLTIGLVGVLIGAIAAAIMLYALWRRHDRRYLARLRYRTIVYLREFVQKRIQELDGMRELGVSQWHLDSDASRIYLHAQVLGKDLVVAQEVDRDWAEKTSWTYACSIAESLLTMMRNYIAAGGEIR